jgi:hypothetical protein
MDRRSILKLFGLIPLAAIPAVAIAAPTPTLEELVARYALWTRFNDRRYRVCNLEPGEIVLFDDKGHELHFPRNGMKFLLKSAVEL